MTTTTEKSGHLKQKEDTGIRMKRIREYFASLFIRLAPKHHFLGNLGSVTVEFSGMGGGEGPLPAVYWLISATRLDDQEPLALLERRLTVNRRVEIDCKGTVLREWG